MLDLIERLRGPHVNPLRYVPGIENMPLLSNGKLVDIEAWKEIERLQKLCFEAANEIECLRNSED